jgi:CRP/FNR family transcriptional regulator, cyclic AMP receptor protein
MANGGFTRIDIIGRSFACGADVAAVIAAKADFRDYAARAAIVRGGAASPHVHIIITGTAQSIALGIDGRMVLVQEFRSGDIFGEGSALLGHNVPDDIVAVSAVHAGRFGGAVFIGLMENYTCVALSVSRRLTERLGTTTRRMVEGATLSANGRIHAELLRQARSSGTMSITPAPVHSEFALRVHSSRETVSRAINALEKRGIIRRGADGLTVVAPHRLEELVY